MDSQDPKVALFGGTNECDMTNTLLLPLSEVSTGAVSLTWVVFLLQEYMSANACTLNTGCSGLSLIIEYLGFCFFSRSIVAVWCGWITFIALLWFWFQVTAVSGSAAIASQRLRQHRAEPDHHETHHKVIIFSSLKYEHCSFLLGAVCQQHY